jgi:hypothetical protein
MALIWGSSFLFTELSLRFLPFYGVSFWRTFLGGLAMFGLVFLLKLQLPKGTRWFHLWVAGVFMSAIPFSLFSYAQQISETQFLCLYTSFIEDGTDLNIIDPWRNERGTLLQMYGTAGWTLERNVYAMAEYRLEG